MPDEPQKAEVAPLRELPVDIDGITARHDVDRAMLASLLPDVLQRIEDEAGTPISDMTEPYQRLVVSALVYALDVMPDPAERAALNEIYDDVQKVLDVIYKQLRGLL